MSLVKKITGWSILIGIASLFLFALYEAGIKQVLFETVGIVAVLVLIAKATDWIK